ncbi:hypothetical protein V5799_021517 [Amblyomma americanum]|uniref:Homeobox domain-containing protein n=1 Tax=Amblyomma americanum TaxID=6943 RepID=A0AAQ4FPQ1_AMBAM
MFPSRQEAGPAAAAFQYACYPSPPSPPPQYAAGFAAGAAVPGGGLVMDAADPGCWGGAYRYDDWALQPQPPQTASFAPAAYAGYGAELAAATSPDSGLAPSDLSGTPSPGLQQAAANVVARPTPARSPFEWMMKPSYQVQPNPGKTRTKDKYRVVYSDHQRLELEKEFHYSRYITIRRKAELAAVLGLSERQVKIWFQNRRAKERKQAKKQEELLHRDLKTEPPPPPPALPPFSADGYS